MTVKISDLYAVAYINNLTGKINVYSKLFANRDEAQKLADETNGVVQPVFFNSEPTSK